MQIRASDLVSAVTWLLKLAFFLLSVFALDGNARFLMVMLVFYCVFLTAHKFGLVGVRLIGASGQYEFSLPNKPLTIIPSNSHRRSFDLVAIISISVAMFMAASIGADARLLFGAFVCVSLLFAVNAIAVCRSIEAEPDGLTFDCGVFQVTTLPTHIEQVVAIPSAENAWIVEFHLGSGEVLPVYNSASQGSVVSLLLKAKCSSSSTLKMSNSNPYESPSHACDTPNLKRKLGNATAGLGVLALLYGAAAFFYFPGLPPNRGGARLPSLYLMGIGAFVTIIGLSLRDLRVGPGTRKSNSEISTVHGILILLGIVALFILAVSRM